MDQGKIKALLLCGAIVPIWLLIGVAITGYLHPNYSHLSQALSELGATGSPTHIISPIINNIPIGILFILFSLGVLSAQRKNKLVTISSLLLFLHGAASITAGIYSCDAGCAPKYPSASQHIHNIAGLVMFLSLVFTNLIWIFIGPNTIKSRKFTQTSIICLLVSIITAPLMVYGISHGTFGVFQRINYGSQVLWVMALAYYLYLNTVKANKRFKSFASLSGTAYRGPLP